jgi:hypothetical protein
MKTTVSCSCCVWPFIFFLDKEQHLKKIVEIMIGINRLSQADVTPQEVAR